WAQAEPLAEIRTLQGYADWMKGLLSFMPDGRYAVKSFATDDDRNSVCAYGVFSATHTGEGGPCPPTGKSTRTDYVYVMEFDGDKIRHMTKIWNAGWGDARTWVGIAARIRRPSDRSVFARRVLSDRKVSWNVARSFCDLCGAPPVAFVRGVLPKRAMYWLFQRCAADVRPSRRSFRSAAIRQRFVGNLRRAS